MIGLDESVKYGSRKRQSGGAGNVGPEHRIREANPSLWSEIPASSGYHRRINEPQEQP